MTKTAADNNQSEQSEQSEQKVVKLVSHARTISETDIVNFVNLVGLHEPLFIDMSYIEKHMEASHQERFAPAPMIISIGMGLVATYVSKAISELIQGEDIGAGGGLVGLEAKVKAAVHPGDTIRVELEARIGGRTSRNYTIIELLHVVKNQHDVTVSEFTEKAIFMPPEAG
ncbi:MAG: MaoC family dehydratase [Pseudomonadales bacterium]|nr:MaoC family dehydratase [Pseudomonadales bacterium]